MSSSHESAVRLGEYFGYVLWPALVLLGGVLLARKLNKDRDFGNSVRWPIFASLALVALFGLGQCTAHTRNTNRVDIQIFDGGSAGAVPENVDVDVLHQIEASATAKIGKSIPSEDGKGAKSVARSTSLSAQNLVLVETFIDNVLRVQQYAGVVNGKEKIVACATQGKDADVNVLQSTCAAKAGSVFASNGTGPK